jgi:hypothetical protein
MDLRYGRLKVQFYFVSVNTPFFLEFRTPSGAYDCKSKYCPSVAGPRTNSRKSHVGLRKTVYYLKCKVGRMPFCFSSPDLLYYLGYRNIHMGANTSEMDSLLFLGGNRSEKLNKTISIGMRQIILSLLCKK